MATIVKINGRSYENFQDLEISKTFDSAASTFSFNGKFDTNNAAHRRIFKPLTYNKVEIFDDSTLLLTGTILSHRFSPSSNDELVPVSGYSLPGVLGDVSVPPEKYPLEVNQKSLIDITKNLIDKFNIGLVVDPSVSDDANKLYEKSTAKDKQSIGNYISQLASQRNIIVSHTPKGELLFTRPSKNTASIATYREGMPTLKFDLSVNGQGMHSQLTVQKQAAIGSDLQGDETINNPLITAFRPRVIEQTKGDAGDTPNAARNAIAAELKNISLTIETDRWIWFDGRVISILDVNNYIDVIAPRLYMANRVNWFVSGIIFEETAQGRKATINAVLPETFNGETPKNIFSL